MIRSGDYLAIGLLLIAIFVGNLALKSSGTFIKLIGIIGAAIVIIAESVYLYQFWNRR